MIDTTCAPAAAYVLGSLPASERAQFETHLARCADCQATVREFAGIPGLLARISPEELEQPPLPETLVPGLLRAVRRRRSRHRALTGALAAAAVVLAVLGTMAALSGPEVEAPGTAMSQVVPSPIHATARLSPQGDGTRIELTCRYEGTSSSTSAHSYTLVVVEKSGVAHQIASWLVGPDREVSITGSVELAHAQIARVEIRTAQGVPLLQLTN